MYHLRDMIVGNQPTLIRLLLVMFVFLYALIADGQQQPANTEVQEFRFELDQRATSSDRSFEAFQEQLLKLLKQKQLRTHELQHIDQRKIQMPKDIYSNLEEWTDPSMRGINVLLNYSLLIIGIIVLAAVVVFFFQKIRSNLISDVEHNFIQGLETSPVTKKSALDQAQKFEQHRDFREAIRYLYLTVVLRLHERGVLSYDKSLTNREYLHELKAYPELQKAFQPVVYIFDDVWYGHKRCGSETVAEYRGLVQKIHEVQR